MLGQLYFRHGKIETSLLWCVFYALRLKPENIKNDIAILALSAGLPFQMRLEKHDTLYIHRT